MTSLTVVFDLDGTLVDTAPDLIDTLNVILTRERLPPIGHAEGRTMIGGGVRRLIEKALEFEGCDAISGRADRMLAAFIDHYAAHIADRSRPFPGLDRALDELANQGCRMAVCTNKRERLSRLLLDKLGLSQRFHAICGPDTYGIEKPDPEILQRTVAAAGGDLACAVMVGDSAIDVATARGAGIPVVAVDFGYSDPPVAHFGPNRLIGHFDELPAAIAAVMAAPSVPNR